MASWINLHSLFELAVLALGVLIQRSIKTPKDHERATLLTTLADDAAAVVVNVSGNAPWSQLVRDTVSRLDPKRTTNNILKLEQAAIAALVRLGKTQAPTP